uniref:Uncharacterized protein n=1 Tax=Graphocephala atropunctata TaxID=36148 RepID=A0A1B6MRI6_9HEMI
MNFQLLTVKYYLFLLYVMQAVLLTCQAQEVEVLKGSWNEDLANCDLKEESFEENFQSGLIGGMQNEMAMLKSENEKENVSVDKRAGKDLREKGKRRKIMMNHNRAKGADELSKKEYGKDVSSEVHMNFTGNDGDYMKMKKYTISNRNTLGDNENTHDKMSSMLKILGHNVSPPKSRKYPNEPNAKLGRSRGHSAKKIKEFRVKNLNINESNNIRMENIERSTKEASLKNELYKKRNNLKGRNFSAKHTNSNEEIIKPILQRKKIKDEISAKNKQENENQINSNKIVPILKNPTLDDKNFKLNSDEIKKDNLNIDANHYTNLSAINKSFLDAFAKKIYGMKNDLNSQYNTKELSHLDTKTHVTGPHSNKNDKWIFYNKRVDKNRHVKDQYDRSKMYGKPYVRNNLANDKYEKFNARKAYRLNQNAPNKNIKVLHENEKTHHAKPTMTKQSIEKSKNNKHDANPTTNIKHRRRARRPLKNFGYLNPRNNDGSSIIDNDNALKDLDSSNSVELSDFPLDSNIGEGKRSERDTSKHNTDDETNNNSFFNQPSREETDDQRVNGNVPEIQDDFISGMDSNEMSESKSSSLEGKDSKQVQQHSNSRKNTLRLREEEVESGDYSNDERKDYESKYDEDECSTDSCVEYKADQSTTESTTSTSMNNYSTAKPSSTKAKTTPKSSKKTSNNSKN